jgi:hypothetical protein
MAAISKTPLRRSITTEFRPHLEQHEAQERWRLDDQRQVWVIQINYDISPLDQQLICWVSAKSDLS